MVSSVECVFVTGSTIERLFWLHPIETTIVSTSMVIIEPPIMERSIGTVRQLLTYLGRDDIRNIASYLSFKEIISLEQSCKDIYFFLNESPSMYYSLLTTSHMRHLSGQQLIIPPAKPLLGQINQAIADPLSLENLMKRITHVSSQDRNAENISNILKSSVCQEYIKIALTNEHIMSTYPLDAIGYHAQLVSLITIYLAFVLYKPPLI
jgi:hypothetical protein